MIRRLIPVVYVLLLLLSVRAKSSDSDSQIWLDQTFGRDLSENYSLQIDQSFRFRENVSKLETYTVQAGLRQHRRSWIEHGYYLRYLRNHADDKKEFRPVYDLILKWNLGNTRWSTRNRFEYRIREEQSDTLRYRNRLRLVTPWKLTSLQLKPYGAGEIFLNFDNDDSAWEKNRFRGTLGLQTEPDGYIRKLELKHGRRFSSDIYLMYQQTLSAGAVIDEFILGFKVGFFF